jgi:AcrR family transcriptional regulator
VTDPKPPRRDAVRNRLRIVEATRGLVAEAGFDVSHDDIAKAAEVGVGTVYRHFPDKNEIFEILFEEKLATVVELAEAAAAIEDPWDGLVAFLTGNLELQAADRSLRDLILGSGDARELGARLERSVGPAVGTLVARAKAAGALRPEVELGDFPLVQIMIGAILTESRHVDPQLWRRALALVLDGYRAGPHPQPPPGEPLSAEGVAAMLGRS